MSQMPPHTPVLSIPLGLRVGLTLQIKLDLCGTRIAAPHALFKSLLLMAPALQRIIVSPPPTLSKLPQVALDITAEQWEVLREVEAILHTIKEVTTVSQFEQHFTGELSFRAFFHMKPQIWGTLTDCITPHV